MEDKRGEGEREIIRHEKYKMGEKKSRKIKRGKLLNLNFLVFFLIEIKKIVILSFYTI